MKDGNSDTETDQKDTQAVFTAKSMCCNNSRSFLCRFFEPNVKQPVASHFKLNHVEDPSDSFAHQRNNKLIGQKSEGAPGA